MNIVKVDAKERFGDTELNNVVVDGMASSMYGIYTCPKCHESIAFQKRHFEDALNRTHTNLTPQIAALVDEYAKEHLIREKHFLDWVCPGCELSVRVYLKSWGGGRHGDGGADLTTVIETLANG